MSVMQHPSSTGPVREEEPLFVLPIPVVVPATPQAPAGLLRRIAGWVGTAWEALFGTLVLMLALAVLAAVPVVQFLTFGYLLEVGGRVGRSGRLRDGFIGYRQAA